ncbi:MAG TPA: electron transfer flavoprotein-ubiquinone oxidoreductase [Planctomycetota bacterium]|nr:electron transfer flavoprotein-ubiquinone oxidoreductase [Planctomycetota bacterium]
MTERDSLQCSVLFVGGGPASLAGAIRLADMIAAHNATSETKIDIDSKPIMVIEKAPEPGMHQLSGAILDPKALAELIPDYLTRATPAPFESPALHDQLVMLFARPLPLLGKSFLRAPIVPPTFHNEGNYITSLYKLTRWLADIATEKGVQVLSGFPGAEVLYGEDGEVKGVRTGDKGVGRDGEKKASYEPGNDLLADVTIFGEGSRGSLTKDLVARFKLDQGKNPQIYSTGVKELWKVPKGRLSRGQVIHTSGYPLQLAKAPWTDHEEFGGGFIYALSDELVSLGFVVSLDSPDPFLDPHRKFSEWKSHPFIREILEGGEIQRYGAKTIPEGGWFSIPRPYMPGAMLVGDSAGFMNMTRLKGIHLAMKSGMLAGETAFDILRSGQPATEEKTKTYWHRVLDSWIFKELWAVRNFRQCFQGNTFGFIEGAAKAGLAISLGGMLMPGALPLVPDHERMRKIPTGKENLERPPAPDGLRPTVSLAADVLRKRLADGKSMAPKDPLIPQPAMSIKSSGVVFDKVTDVFHSGSTHDEDQPPHLVVTDTDVCHTRCAEEYGNPCQYFCPAAVYEMAETPDGKGRRLQLNFSNCVHCKTCDIRDPYQIITWVTPEGGGGPQYVGL